MGLHFGLNATYKYSVVFYYELVGNCTILVWYGCYDHYSIAS